MDPTQNQNGAFGNQPPANMGSSGMPMGADNTVAPIGDGTGDIILAPEKKSKKWWIVGGVVGAVICLGVTMWLFGVMNDATRSEKVSNEELVERLDQVNYDLSILSDEYNEMFGGMIDSVEIGSFFTDLDLTEDDLRYDELDGEISEFPLSENTVINSNDKEIYSKYLEEIKIRFNTMKEGHELFRKFQVAFILPILDYANGNSNDLPESVEKSELLNDENDTIRKVANEFDGLYQVIKQKGLNEEAIREYLTGHSDLRNNFMQCFERIEEPSGFYDRLNGFIRELEERYHV